MPLYLVSEAGQPAAKDRFIRAISSSAALNYVTQDRFTCKNIAKADDIDDVLARGLKVERVTDAPVATAAESPEPVDGGDAAATGGEDETAEANEPAPETVGSEDE